MLALRRSDVAVLNQRVRSPMMAAGARPRRKPSEASGLPDDSAVARQARRRVADLRERETQLPHQGSP